MSRTDQFDNFASDANTAAMSQETMRTHLAECRGMIDRGELIVGADLQKYCVLFGFNVLERFDTLAAAQAYAAASNLHCAIYCPDVSLSTRARSDAST